MRCRKISHKTRHISSSESDSSGSSDDDDTSPYSKFPKSPNDDSVSSLDPQEGSDDGSDDDSVYSLEPLQGSDDGDTEQVSKDIQTLFSPRGELERSFSFSDDECTSESPLQTEKDAHCIETKEQQVMDR